MRWVLLNDDEGKHRIQHGDRCPPHCQLPFVMLMTQPDLVHLSTTSERKCCPHIRSWQTRVSCSGRASRGTQCRYGTMAEGLGVHPDVHWVLKMEIFPFPRFLYCCFSKFSTTCAAFSKEYIYIIYITFIFLLYI